MLVVPIWTPILVPIRTSMLVVSIRTPMLVVSIRTPMLAIKLYASWTYLFSLLCVFLCLRLASSF